MCKAQDITFIADKVLIQDTAGKEIVFNCRIKNISSIQQTVFLVRTKNILPANWKSSLCFGNNCFPPTLDSLVTTADYNSKPLSPQEERDASLHVFTTSLSGGAANIRIEAGTILNPNSRVILDFAAESIPTPVNVETGVINKFRLEQNYPNPFNPTTTISYSLPKAGDVRLIIYNAIGSKISTIVNEYKQPGSYSVKFNGGNFANGIYLYRLESGNYSAVKKFILLK
jgi:hypothetical protein